MEDGPDEYIISQKNKSIVKTQLLTLLLTVFPRSMTNLHFAEAVTAWLDLNENNHVQGINCRKWHWAFSSAPSTDVYTI